MDYLLCNDGKERRFENLSAIDGADCWEVVTCLECEAEIDCHSDDKIDTAKEHVCQDNNQ